MGDLFVTRVAGNIATAEIIGSLEYGAAALGTQVILVLGHTSCGAVSAAVAGKAVPGQISGLFAGLLPAVEQAPNDVEAAIRANVRHQVRVLERGSPVLAERVAAGQLVIRGGVLELATGRVTLL